MWNATMNLTIFMIAIVITREQILTDIPIGTPKQHVEEYFEGLTDKEWILYFTRENPQQGTVSHELSAGESGYYLIGLRYVRDRWWQPSLGRHLAVIVVISDADLVSEIKFFGSRSGWP
jgi:hypothetical protein